MKKQKSATGYLIGINVMQLILAGAILAVETFTTLRFSYTVKGIIFIVQSLIWLVFSFVAALGSNMAKKKHAFLFAFLAVLPILILFAICCINGHLTDVKTATWPAFFFFGAPLIFFLKPAVFLAIFIPGSAYLVYGVNIFVMFLMSLVGCLMGVSANSKKQRDRGKEERSEEKPKKKKTGKASKADLTEQETDELPGQTAVTTDTISRKDRGSLTDGDSSPIDTKAVASEEKYSSRRLVQDEPSREPEKSEAPKTSGKKKKKGIFKKGKKKSELKKRSDDK